MVRLEVLGDDELARELEELLVLTGIAEVPDETGSPPGLPSGRRNEPPEMTPELVARVRRAAEGLESRIELMRDDLLGLELARRRLLELLEQREQGSGSRGSTDA